MARLLRNMQRTQKPQVRRSHTKTRQKATALLLQLVRSCLPAEVLLRQVQLLLSPPMGMRLWRKLRKASPSFLLVLMVQ